MTATATTEPPIIAAMLGGLGQSEGRGLVEGKNK